MKRLLLFFAATSLAFGADLSGDWLFKVEGVPISSVGVANPLLLNFSKMSQKGYTIFYNGPNGSTMLPLVQGDRVSFVLEIAPAAANSASISFIGRVNSAGTQIKGGVQFRGKRGKFVAVRGG